MIRQCYGQAEVRLRGKGGGGGGVGGTEVVGTLTRAWLCSHLTHGTVHMYVWGEYTPYKTCMSMHEADYNTFLHEEAIL